MLILALGRKRQEELAAGDEPGPQSEALLVLHLQIN